MASKKERPVLPFGDLLQDGVGNGRDQVGRHLDAVEFLQMAADLTHAHAPRIHRDDLVVEIRKAALVLGDQLRIEGPGPVARDRQCNLRRARQNRLAGMAVAPIGIAVGVLVKFERPAGPVDFTERNAIDVESMGLYWHFVDIVWIVIFTAVYLLEFL